MKLFIPGPTMVQKKYLNKMASPLIGHRSQEYIALHKQVTKRLKEIFEAHDYHVYVLTGSASLAMEAAIKNCVKKKVLHTVCGAFSKRWMEISKENGKQVLKVEVPWGQAILPETLEKPLSLFQPEAVCLTHLETSTGILNPVKKLSKYIKRKSDALVLVDAVSSAGGLNINLQKTAIDVLVFGTQKCLALPPGLSFAFVSKTAFKKSKAVKNKGYYTNFEIYEKYALKNQTPSTPNISLMFALNEKLKDILEEGVVEREKRHVKMQRVVKKWMGKHSLIYFPDPKFTSPTVSVIKNTLPVPTAKLVNELKKQGQLLAAGYGQLKEDTFRIGHLGDHTVNSIQTLLKKLDLVIDN